MSSCLTTLIEQRESVRAYQTTPIPREEVDACIEASRLAPSACNSQEWHFVVVDNKDLKDRLCDEVFSGPYHMNMFVKQAPVVIAVVSDQLRWTARVGKFLKQTDFYLIDIGIACEHLVLKAAELGIGSCYIGWFNEEKVKEILHIPKKRRVDLLISLGYPQSAQARNKMRKAFKEIVSYNEYHS